MSYRTNSVAGDRGEGPVRPVGQTERAGGKILFAGSGDRGQGGGGVGGEGCFLSPAAAAAGEIEACLTRTCRSISRSCAHWLVAARMPGEYAHSTGLKVFLSSLQNMRFPAETFDFIVTLHVIEHVQNLEKTICEIRRVLKQGGDIYFVVPCISHIKARLAGTKWHYLGPPGHPWYFTTGSLRQFLEKNGFVVEFASCFSNIAHLRILARKS